VECNQCENPVQGKRQTVENQEKTYIASHADLPRLVTRSFPCGEERVNLVTKTPGKTKRGSQFAVFTKKNRDFSRLRNKIRMRPRGTRERKNVRDLLLILVVPHI